MRVAAAPIPRGSPSARGKTLVPPAGRTPTGIALPAPLSTSLAVPSPPIAQTPSKPSATASAARSPACPRRCVSTISTSHSGASARSAVRSERSFTPEATGLTIRRRRGRGTASASLEARRALLRNARRPRRGRPTRRPRPAAAPRAPSRRRASSARLCASAASSSRVPAAGGPRARRRSPVRQAAPLARQNALHEIERERLLGAHAPPAAASSNARA